MYKAIRDVIFNLIKYTMFATSIFKFFFFQSWSWEVR